MEMEILYRLSIMVGFLLAGFLFIVLIGLAAAVYCLSKSSFKAFDRMIGDLKELEEVCRDDSES